MAKLARKVALAVHCYLRPPVSLVVLSFNHETGPIPCTYHALAYEMLAKLDKLRPSYCDITIKNTVILRDYRRILCDVL